MMAHQRVLWVAASGKVFLKTLLKLCPASFLLLHPYTKRERVVCCVGPIWRSGNGHGPYVNGVLILLCTIDATTITPFGGPQEDQRNIIFQIFDSPLLCFNESLAFSHSIYRFRPVIMGKRSLLADGSVIFRQCSSQNMTHNVLRIYIGNSIQVLHWYDVEVCPLLVRTSSSIDVTHGPLGLANRAWWIIQHSY